MDQLKKFFAFVKNEQFWILSGLAVLMGLVIYFASSSKLADAYQKQKAKISGIDQRLSPLLAGNDHPNSAWVQQVKADTEHLRHNVKDAWDAIYNDQHLRVFVWPAGLGTANVAAFAQPASADDPLKMIEPCERFQKFVKTEVRHMGAIVDADWPEDAKADNRGHAAGRVPGREPDAAAAAADKTYLVIWDDADRQYWTDAYDWQDRPTPLDVRYAQEELWVMNAICEAIARTNAGAKLNDEAVVREINQMRIGYDATGKFPLGDGEKRVQRLGNVRPSAAAMAPPGPGGVAGGPDQNLVPFEPKRPNRKLGTTDDSDPASRGPVGGGHGMAMNPAGPPGSTAAAGPEDPNARLKDGRYVDPKGRPLLAKDLLDPPVKEYNLMAFRLNLTVDEQRWDRLLLELANSPLPLEVREVRINVDSANGGDAAAGHTGPRRPQQPDSDKGPVRNISLELRGVAYLINPPNAQALGLTDEAPAAPAASGPAVPAPAATAPAVPAPANATPSSTTPPSGVAPTTPPATGTPPAAATTPAGVVPPGATAPAGTAPPAASVPAGPAPTAPPAGAPPATAPAATPPASKGPAAPPATSK